MMEVGGPIQEQPMTTITIEDAQAKLPELIGGLAKGEELVITQGQHVVARIVGERSGPRQRLEPGFAKGMLTIVADDDDHLKDFAEYMP
jgi:antitoxin (DNA-binding transcriptional repressor) of toxin-antitoxin stability system